MGHPFTYLVASLALIALGIWAYSPGLSGDFLFDDFANLPALGATGPVDDWPTFWRYITSGTADPTGRPLALLSFLIDGNSWPTNPYPFKRTNLILHILNGVLLGTFLWRIGCIIAPARPQRAAAAALLGSAMWTLHPFMVSTTLYVVQRQAMLPATFTLLALHGWLRGRQLLARGSSNRANMYMLASVGIGTPLALLSKGNGILLPTLIGVVEIGTLRSWPAPPHPRQLTQMRALLLLAPTLLVSSYLIYRIPSAMEATPTFRPWTLGERLLTQPRILLDYLNLLLVPRPFTSGLYNDSIQVSSGLLAPWTTLPAMILILSMPILGWLVRKRYPLVATAVLFFCIGHLLESSVIPLELYYEHRNYLPSLLMFWPIAWWLTRPGHRYTARTIASVLIVVTLSGMTHARASLWGDSEEQALVWAALNSSSARAQTTAALHEMQNDRPDLAYARLSAAPQSMVRQPQIALNRLNAACLSGAVSADDLATAERALQQAKHGIQLAYGWIDNMLEPAHTQLCKGFSLIHAKDLLAALSTNEHYRHKAQHQQQIHYLEARISLLQGQADLALETLNAALILNPDPAIALQQAATLGNANFPAHGLAHLEYFEEKRSTLPPPRMGMPTLHAWVLEKQGYWPREFSRLRNSLSQHAEELNP